MNGKVKANFGIKLVQMYLHITSHDKVILPGNCLFYKNGKAEYSCHNLENLDYECCYKPAKIGFNNSLKGQRVRNP